YGVLTEERRAYLRHCERSEAIQKATNKEEWIASSRSLSSGAHSRDPLAPRNDELIHLPVLPRPIGIAKISPENLARRVARQRRDEIDRLGGLEPCNPFARKIDDVGRGRRLARLHH